MSKKRSIVFAVLITFVLSSLLTFGAVRIYDSGILSNFGFPMGNNGINDIKRAKNIIQKEYYKEVDDDVLYRGALKGMFEALGDEYSWFVDEEDYRELTVNLTGEYSGIGINVSIDSKDNLITINSAIEDTPAYKAGIKSGDKIIAINSVNVSLENYQEAINMIRGTKDNINQEVVLTLKRAGTGVIEDISLMREHITLKTVKSKMLPQNVGYVRITSFDDQTDVEFEQHIQNLDAANLDGLVIDLRNNGGGTLTSMRSISDTLLPEGVITYFEYKDGNKQYFRSYESYLDVPVAILINGSSASASEALAGAVRDHGRGILVGEKSFGKGIVQTVYPFTQTKKGTTAVYITTATYYTPNGECIHEKGIQPDIEVVMPESIKYENFDDLSIDQDVQLKAAWEHLLK